ncbi:hypothetical protein ACFYW8_24180 [Streptomyces sp. NPDC002742]|uniref:hypothetical protein n=1 Tax=Streptomyces sp. NPDC002742 TaxID=3364663 RepID=UPI0036A951E8
MTRRIALTFMALIVLLLVLAVVPLGLSMTQREHTSFRDTTEAANRTIDGAARLAASALRVFADDVHRHVHTGPCGAAFSPLVLPVPAVRPPEEGEWR